MWRCLVSHIDVNKMSVYIKFYKNVLCRPSTKFMQNLFFIRYNFFSLVSTLLVPSILIQAAPTTKLKLFKESTVYKSYS